MAQEPIEPLLAGADPERGRDLALVCSGCHSFERKQQPGRIGPPLWNVVNRPQASVPEFPYSDALKALDDRWSYEALDRYLSNPQSYAPGNRMMFPGYPQLGDRAHLIAFLRTLSDKPAPLPESATPQVVRRSDQGSEGPPFGGLPKDAGRELVYGTCTACHSIRQVTQQGLNRDRWNETLTWMIERQGMQPPGPDRRGVILDYLAKWYGPERLKVQRPEHVTFIDNLPDSPGRAAVANICTACHSIRQVTQQGLDRDRWDELLDWMVEEQGMAELSPSRRESVLVYLDHWYGPDRLARKVAKSD